MKEPKEPLERIANSLGWVTYWLFWIYMALGSIAFSGWWR